MKYLYSWLKEFYPEIPALEKLQPLLIQLGHDIESCEKLSFENIIVGEVLEVKPHPNADRLRIATVTIGQDEPLSIVCGAPNLAVGQKVPCALVGATLPSGHPIKANAIRGEMSHGMLCAEDELGISNEHAGLMILPDHATAGAPITDYIPQDAILTLDITSDRGDVLSHFGLARDIKSATEGTVLTYAFKKPDYTPNLHPITIETVHPDCQGISFTFAQASNAKHQTPLLIQSRLACVGQKIINVATDITNYVMLSFGQPLHAYDAGKLTNGLNFSVRRAHDGERFQALNGQVLRLTPQNLVIAANDTPVALAGVIGGENTKAESNSETIIFEAATFAPKAVSLSGRGLHLLTDATLRFERGTDSSMRPVILDHALALWCKITGGTIEKPVGTHLESQNEKTTILDPTQLIRFIGTDLPQTKVQKLVESTGSKIIVRENEWSITAPSWRYDLETLEDYAEEIVRLIGFEALDKKPLTASVPQWKRSHYWRGEFTKDTLVALGMNEIQTYPFMSQAELDLFGISHSSVLEVTLAPIKDKNYLRPSLLPSLLTAIANNPETPHVALFEIAHVYGLENEAEHIIIGIAGSNSATIDSTWQNLFERLRLPVSSWMSRVKTIDKTILDFYKIRKPIVTALELPISDFETGKTYDVLPVTIPDLDAIRIKPLSVYQTSRRDVAFIVDSSYDEDTIQKELVALNDHIISVDLFDRYTNAEKLGENKQSLAFHITYQSPSKTLSSEEIDSLQSKVETYIKDHFHGIIR